MDLRAALGLSTTALELYRDKISLRQRSAAARNFKLPQNSTDTRDKYNPAETKFHFKTQALGEIPSHRKQERPSLQKFYGAKFYDFKRD